jgi:TRAP-type C4-dicarboxylate transport system permease small subunit
MSELQAGAGLAAESGLARLTGRACDAAGLMLVALTLLIGAEIAVRTVSGKSTLIADEYSGYLFVWITMIGFAHALQSGTFLRVDNLISLLSRRGQALADLFSAMVGVVVAAVCVYSTGTLVSASYRFGTLSIQPSATPLWLPQIILPLGFLALVGIYFSLFVIAWRRLLSPSKE